MGTFMKGTDDLLLPILDRTMVPAEITAHLHFDYTTMRRLESLQDTILQYPPELLYLMGKVKVTDEEGLELMVQLSANNASAGSDGSVKNGIGGHSFCITNNTFTKKIWGSAQTVGQTSDMTSLRTEHGGDLGILILVYAMYIHYPKISLPTELKVYIDNCQQTEQGSEVDTEC